MLVAISSLVLASLPQIWGVHGYPYERPAEVRVLSVVPYAAFNVL